MCVWLLIVSELRAESPPATPVLIWGTRTFGLAQGTGVVLDTDARWVLTCWHVLAYTTHIDVLLPQCENGARVTDPTPYAERRKAGQALRGTLVAHDPSRDLALLEVPSLPTDAVPVQWARAPKPGDKLTVVGNPITHNRLWWETTGTLRAEAWEQFRLPPEQEVATHFVAFQTPQPVPIGCSGGPVFDDRQQLVGIVSANAHREPPQTLVVAPAEVRCFVARAYVERGFAALRTPNLSDAARWAERAERADPMTAAPLCARVALGQGQWAHARRQFTRAVQTQPAALGDWVGLALASLNERRP
jgi:hypothetical protein